MSTRCAGPCGRYVRCEGLPEPDPGMPHLVMCRACASQALAKRGIAGLPEGMKGMLIPLTAPDWIVPESPAADMIAFIEARAAVARAQHEATP